MYYIELLGTFILLVFNLRHITLRISVIYSLNISGILAIYGLVVAALIIQSCILLKCYKKFLKFKNSLNNFTKIMISFTHPHTRRKSQKNVGTIEIFLNF